MRTDWPLMSCRDRRKGFSAMSGAITSSSGSRRRRCEREGDQLEEAHALRAASPSVGSACRGVGPSFSFAAWSVAGLAQVRRAGTSSGEERLRWFEQATVGHRPEEEPGGGTGRGQAN